MVRSLVWVGILVSASPWVWGLSGQDKTIPMTATVQESPTRVQLSWSAPTSAAYVITHQKIFRRLADGKGSDWGKEYASLATTDLGFTDTAVELGRRYEYRVVRLFSNGPLSATGFIEVGIRVPEVDRRGTVLVLVKDTAAAAMPGELLRLQQDLAGDGWRVIRESITSTQSVEDVKNVIKTQWQNPAISDLRAVFLFGRIPVPYSGRINPDGHDDHLGAWPADVFYADMDGVWTDSVVNDSAASGTRNDNVPGDGKYDQSVLPSSLELEIGRVDLANMTVFPDAATTENDLLLRYLNRNHQYRHRLGGYASVPRRGLVDDLFGYRGNDTFASNAWWNFTSCLGQGNVATANWFTTLNTESYLWAYGAGWGSYTSAAGVGSSAQFGTTDSLAVFNMTFGSYFGDWDTANNFLRAPLAGTENGLGLANMWAGRPHWHLYSMATGATLGHGAKVSQNNNGEYPTGAGGGGVHTALMGDPTLRLFPVLPVSGLGQVASAGKVALTWTASADSGIQGYAIYRGASDARSSGEFSRINGALVTDTAFDDLSGVPGTHYTYMVRAVKLESTASGTYLNSSQGVFIDATSVAVSGPEISLSGGGEPIQDGSARALASNQTAFGGGEVQLDQVERTFTIRNDGASALTLSGEVGVTGSTDFSVVQQPAVWILAAGDEVDFTIRFSPTVIGPREALVTLNSDDPDEAAFSFVVSGVGTPQVPDLVVSATSFDQSLAAGATGVSTLNLQNQGLGNLDFKLMSDYAFRRSTDGDGPSYRWMDIAGIGMEITDWSGTSYATDNGGSSPLAMGFDFPFYGQLHDSVVVSTEGFLTFGTWVDAPTSPAVLPNLGAPANLVAVYWDDLDLRGNQGKVYYLQKDPDTFVVQYEGVYPYRSDPSPDDERLSCQVIFKSSGEMIFQYKEIPSTEHFLAGVQNAELDRGLRLAGAGHLLASPMAIRLLPPAETSWLGLSSSSGTVLPSANQNINLDFDPSGIPFADYFGWMRLETNDPDSPLLEIDLSMLGGDVVPEIEVSANNRPIAYQSTDPVLANHTLMGELAPDAAVQVRVYTIENKGSADLNLGSVTVTGSDFVITAPGVTTLAAGASTTFQLGFASGKPVGDYSTTVNIPSNDANEANFTFVVKVTNLSWLEDWRAGHFGSASNSGVGADDADPDGDGLVNLLEYALGGNPQLNDAAAILPSVAGDGAGRNRFTFVRDPAKTDISYSVQVSDTMGPGTWVTLARSVGGATTVPVTGAHAVSESGLSPVEVTVTDAAVNPARRFYRLSVSVP